MLFAFQQLTKRYVIIENLQAAKSEVTQKLKSELSAFWNKDFVARDSQGKLSKNDF